MIPGRDQRDAQEGLQENSENNYTIENRMKYSMNATYGKADVCIAIRPMLR